VETGQRIARVDVDETDAYAIAVPVNSYRGVVAIRESEGHVLAITEQEMREAQATLGKTGIWSEISSVISFAGALRASELPLTGDGPLVAINTSNGFKDNGVGHNPIPLIDGSWEALQALLN
jgi:threonine synthase